MTVLDCEGQIAETNRQFENKVLKEKLDELTLLLADYQSQVSALKKEIGMFKQTWDSWSEILLAQMSQFQDDWKHDKIDQDSVLPYIDGWKEFVHNGSNAINRQIQKACRSI